MHRLMFSALLMLATAPTWAAFRSASYSYTGTYNTITCAAPAGYQAGDILIESVSQDGSGGTFTYSSGWTKVRTDNITNGDSETVSWGWKVATGSDTFTITGTTSGNASCIVEAFSGDNTTTPIDVSSVNNPNSSSVPTSPVSMIGLSVTTTGASEDLTLLGVVDTNGSNGTWSASPSALTLAAQATSTDSFSAAAAFYGTASSAGATGNQTVTWTQSGAKGNFVGYLIALSPSGGGSSCTHAGWTSGGASAVPNGTSGSYWGKSGAWVTPDCSTVQYWQPAVSNFAAN